MLLTGICPDRLVLLPVASSPDSASAAFFVTSRFLLTLPSSRLLFLGLISALGSSLVKDIRCALGILSARFLPLVSIGVSGNRCAIAEAPAKVSDITCSPVKWKPH